MDNIYKKLGTHYVLKDEVAQKVYGKRGDINITGGVIFIVITKGLTDDEILLEDPVFRAMEYGMDKRYYAVELILNGGFNVDTSLAEGILHLGKLIDGIEQYIAANGEIVAEQLTEDQASQIIQLALAESN